MIKQALKSSWDDQRIWKQIWKAQSEFLQQTENRKTIHIEGKVRKGKLLKATKGLIEKQQRAVDAVVLNIVGEKTIEGMRQDPNVMKILKSLQKALQDKKKGEI